MLMLSLFEPFDLPLIRAKYYSFNLVIYLLLFRTLIDSLDLFPQNFTFKGDLVIISHFLSQGFLRCFTIIKEVSQLNLVD
jgi:hypothetical protein